MLPCILASLVCQNFNIYFISCAVKILKYQIYFNDTPNTKGASPCVHILPIAYVHAMHKHEKISLQVMSPMCLCLESVELCVKKSSHSNHPMEWFYAVSCPWTEGSWTHTPLDACVQHQYTRAIPTLKWTKPQEIWHHWPRTLCWNSCHPKGNQRTRRQAPTSQMAVWRRSYQQDGLTNWVFTRPQHPHHKDSIKSENIFFFERIQLYVSKTSGLGAQGHCIYVTLLHTWLYANPAGLRMHCQWNLCMPYGDKLYGDFMHKNYGHPTHTDTWRRSLATPHPPMEPTNAAVLQLTSAELGSRAWFTARVQELSS